MDAISHLTRHLELLNESVKILQTATFHQRQRVDELETRRQQNVHGKFEAHATFAAGKFLQTKVRSFESVTQKIVQIFRSVGVPITSSTIDTDAGTYVDHYRLTVHLSCDQRVRIRSTYGRQCV